MRAGLLASSLFAVALALALPSVVALWYTVGSCVIPGLLVPLLAAYAEPLRVGPRTGFAASAAGVIASTTAWAWGSQAPFFPGLAASLAVWAAGRLARAATEPAPSRP